MVDHKPLPALPALNVLSLDARQQRSQLIRSFLHEILDPSIEKKRDAWVYVFEEALDELGRALSQGKWLEGVRRLREQQREARGRERERDELKRQETVKAKKRHGAKSSDEGESGEVSLVERSSTPTALSVVGVKHLFLCVAPPSSLPSEDNGFHIVPSNIGCSFVAGTYALQDAETPTVLFGSKEGSTAQMVGGTFTFRGITSPQQHSALSRVLRLSIYVHLSLTLEQHFLVDSSIALLFPRLRLAPSLHTVPPRPPIEYKGRKYRSPSFMPMGLRSLLPFKSSNEPRAMTIMSMPLTRKREHDSPPARVTALPRSSFELPHSFRFSILGSSSTKQPSPVIQETAPLEHRSPFTHALETLQANTGLLSTSPGVRFEPPSLIVELAEHEKRGGHARRLRGDERVGLSSVLGWEEGNSKENLPVNVNGMVGSAGFVRQQGIEVLESRHVPCIPDGGDAEGQTGMRTMCGRARWRTFRYYAYSCLNEDEELDTPLGSIVRQLVEESGKQCETAGCKFLMGQHEVRIVHGGVRISISVDAEERGENEEGEEGKVEMWVSCGQCGAKSEKREMTDGTYLLSFGKFIELLIYSPALTRTAPSPAICACSTSTVGFNVRRHFGVGVGGLKNEGKDGRRHVVSFACSKVDNIFELRVPRLQVSSSSGVGLSSREHDPPLSLNGTRSGSGDGEREGGKEGGEDEKEKRELRREIRRWWEGVADYLDKLETFFADADTDSHDFLKSGHKRKLKALPRLPSMGDYHSCYYYDRAIVDIPPVTIRSLSLEAKSSGSPQPQPRPSTASLSKDSSPVLSIPPAPPPPPPAASTLSSSSTTPIGNASAIPTLNLPVTPTPSTNPTHRLSSLRQSFHLTEQSLYAQLGQTRGDQLNDVRRAFLCSARGAERRLCAWRGKYLRLEEGKGKGKEERESLEWRGSEEPGWWGAGWHVFPGSSVIVDEKDWGSVIAFTLSAADYQREMNNHIPVARQPSSSELHTQPQQQPIPIPSSSSQPQQPPSTNNTPTSNHSFFTAMRLFTPSSSITSMNPDPDPDMDDPAAWTDPEELFSAVISRKEHPKDAASLLNIREVLRAQRSLSPAPPPVAGSSSGGGSGAVRAPSPSLGTEKFGSLGRGSGPTPASAPDVGVSRDDADGAVSVSGQGSEAATAERILQSLENEGASGEMSKPVSRAEVRGSVVLDGTSSLEGKKAESRLESGDEGSVKSDRTIGKSVVKEEREDSEDVAPPPPPKDERHIPQQEMRRDVSNTGTASSFASTLTNGLSNAMRFVLYSTSGGNTNAANEPARSGSPFSHHRAPSLSLEGAAGIDGRPHIKFDWTVGKRLKFSCTVYYAKQFALLRKGCGIDDDLFVRSLRKSKNWIADGGKSRSNFWKTEDERFIIKTLVDAWNVADLQVLIDLSPSYFRYMDTTASNATVLAKMIGFYTIEIRNLETGNIQSKADLLVMENLFYHQTITKTFDLKGIQGRKVKPSNGSKVTQKSKTLFDGEWIEGRQKALILVRPHSRQVLRAAIRSDADFLAKSNIMDYSLLIGLDEEHKQIACGLVDTIGSYTFAKTLEYKAKHGLKSDKEITVIPPVEYQERFVNALEGYFLACPDKWSKPTDESKIVSDTNLLPSVL